MKHLAAAPGAGVLGAVGPGDARQVRGQVRPLAGTVAVAGEFKQGQLRRVHRDQLYSQRLLHVRAQDEASDSVAPDAEQLGVAPLAVDFSVGRVVARDRVQRTLALVTIEAFLQHTIPIKHVKYFQSIRCPH